MRCGSECSEKGCCVPIKVGADQITTGSDCFVQSLESTGDIPDVTEREYRTHDIERAVGFELRQMSALKSYAVVIGSRCCSGFSSMTLSSAS
jgi:hypothetical protein